MTIDTNTEVMRCLVQGMLTGVMSRWIEDGILAKPASVASETDAQGELLPWIDLRLASGRVLRITVEEAPPEETVGVLPDGSIGVVVQRPWHDPTHGRIDRDIQDQVSAMEPSDIAQRAAMEQTLQDRRDREKGV